jgi:hypothetical protein
MSDFVKVDDFMQFIKVCIVDWDDTLFPTTEFKDFEIEMLTTYPELDDKICKLFEEISKHAIPHIVTNASAEWINNCMAIFPKFRALNIPYISAREFNEGFDMTQWKSRTFACLCENYSANRIITLGDRDEHVHASRLIGSIVDSVASIRFKKDPTLLDIYNQLDICTAIIPDIINSPDPQYIISLKQLL